MELCLHPPVCFRGQGQLNLYLRLDLPSGVICYGFSTKILNAFRLSYIHATCPSFPPISSSLIWRELQVMKLNFIQLYPPSFCVFPLGPNIFPNTPFYSTRRTPTTPVSGFTSRSAVDNLSALK